MRALARMLNWLVTYAIQRKGSRDFGDEAINDISDPLQRKNVTWWTRTRQ